MSNRFALFAILAVLTAGCASQPRENASPEQPPVASPPATPAAGPVSPPTTDQEMIASAMSAAPESVSRDATIIALDDKMQVRTLRQGSSMWTCVPDGPSPGVDPMCVDKNGLEWMNAWLQRKDPPADKLGFGYMLMGGSDASNDDPFATAPPAGGHWVDTGPHVMIFNVGKRFEGYPATHDDPTRPYIMWGNTPYAHLMIPVK